jgi:hypothetical protein
MSLPAKPISPGEIENTLKKLPDCKSPGNDLITNKILKNLPKKCIIYLTYIYYGMLRLSYSPSIWKSAVIILIHKSGKPKH